MTKSAKFLGLPEDVRVFKESNKLVLHSNVGIEIELEQLDNHTGILKEVSEYWTFVQDHSLRGDNSVEAHLKWPLFGQDLVKAINIFSNAIEKKTSKYPHMSERTSLHIHLDIRDLTTTELGNLISLCLITEPLLYNYVAEHRRNNHFCVPIRKKDGLIRELGALYSDFLVGRKTTTRYNLNEDTVKYAGINFAAVFSYGSIEFRMHQGAWDSASILRWINIILCLKRYVLRTREFNIPDVNDSNIRAFLTDVFQEYYKYFEVTSQSVLHEIRLGIKLAMDMVFGKEFNKIFNNLLRDKCTASNDEEALLTKYSKKHSRKKKVANQESPQAVRALNRDECILLSTPLGVMKSLFLTRAQQGRLLSMHEQVLRSMSIEDRNNLLNRIEARLIHEIEEGLIIYQDSEGNTLRTAEDIINEVSFDRWVGEIPQVAPSPTTRSTTSNRIHQGTHSGRIYSEESITNESPTREGDMFIRASTTEIPRPTIWTTTDDGITRSNISSDEDDSTN
jgi:hypothetical protein